jgi:hypothetical protein
MLGRKQLSGEGYCLHLEVTGTLAVKMEAQQCTVLCCAVLRDTQYSKLHRLQNAISYNRCDWLCSAVTGYVLS